MASGGITPQPAMDWPITAYDAQPQPSAVSYATGTTILPLIFSGSLSSILDGACGKRRTWRNVRLSPKSSDHRVKHSSATSASLPSDFSAVVPRRWR